MIKHINEEEIFAINPNFKVYSDWLGDSKCVIVDDFYLYPEKVRELALSLPAAKNMARNSYPGLTINLGLNMTYLADVFLKLIKENFSDGPCKSDVDIVGAFNYITFLVNVMQGTNQQYPHTDSADPGSFAATLYLNYDDEAHGGTAFYSKEGVMYGYSEMAFNRLVLYRQNVIHTAMIEPDWFTGDTYRINQMFFI